MKTLIIGASDKPERYANIALKMLQKYGHDVVGIAKREMVVSDVNIQKGQPAFEDIDTIALYLSAQYQAAYYDYMLSLNPRRVIFNPGTENPELYSILKSNGIACEEACTLVLLSTDQY